MALGQTIAKILSVALLSGALGRPSVHRDDILSNHADAKVQFAYFTNWGIYGANFQPTDVDVEPLTHILYSFADIQQDGTIFLTDSWADEEKHFAGDSWTEPGNNLYGCLKQLYLKKLATRNLKLLLSIGGWTYSQNGHFDFVTDPAKRDTFVKSAVQLIKDYGFDGIDIDYEYPGNGDQAQAYADLLASVRKALDQLADSNGDDIPYQLTAAVPAGPENYKLLNITEMDKALTYWNLMAYDYAGSWLNFTYHQANLYGGELTGLNTDQAITYYTEQGATPSKITLGIPLYGRAFEDTDGLGKSYNGIGPGTIEPGVYSYKYLPFSGAEVVENTTDVTSYSYDPVKREFVTYDTPHIAYTKGLYVISKGLAGGMFWELSQDKTGSYDSLVSTTAKLFGTLDQTKNHVNYSDSKWDNIRNNMGQNSSSSLSSTNVVPPSAPSSGFCWRCMMGFEDRAYLWLQGYFQ